MDYTFIMTFIMDHASIISFIIALCLLVAVALLAKIQIQARKSFSQMIVEKLFPSRKKERSKEEASATQVEENEASQNDPSQVADKTSTSEQQKNRENGSFMDDTLYYWMLSFTYLYCVLQLIAFLMDGKWCRAIVSVLLGFAVGYLREVIERHLGIEVKSLITGTLIAVVFCIFFFTTNPTKGDWATLCYDIAMLIVIIEAVFPFDEEAKNYAKYLKCGINALLMMKEKIRPTSVYAGMAAIFAQYIGSLLSLSTLDRCLAIRILAAWFAICFGIGYVIWGLRVCHWRKIFAAEARDNCETASIQTEKVAAEKEQ